MPGGVGPFLPIHLVVDVLSKVASVFSSRNPAPQIPDPNPISEIFERFVDNSVVFRASGSKNINTVVYATCMEGPGCPPKYTGMQVRGPQC